MTELLKPKFNIIEPHHVLSMLIKKQNFKSTPRLESAKYQKHQASAESTSSYKDQCMAVLAGGSQIQGLIFETASNGKYSTENSTEILSQRTIVAKPIKYEFVDDVVLISYK